MTAPLSRDGGDRRSHEADVLNCPGGRSGGGAEGGQAMVGKALTFMGAVTALVTIPFFLYSFGPPPHLIAIIVASAEFVALAVLYLFERVLNKPVLSRIYGMRVPRDSILLNGQQRFTIDADYALAQGEVSKHIVFLGKADPGEMYDTFESSEEELVSGQWSSPDSDFTGVKNRGRHRKLRYWTPKHPVAPYSEYVHTISKSGAGQANSWGPDGFYWLVDFDRPTGEFDVTITGPAKIVSATATTLSGRRRHKVRQRFLWRMYRGELERLKGQQPTVSEDGMTMSWRVKSPACPQCYVILCVFEGQYELFKWNRDNEPPWLLSRTPWVWKALHRAGARPTTPDALPEPTPIVAAPPGVAAVPQASPPRTHSSPPAR